MFERLRRFQVTEGLTWKQVSERLGISVSTIMAVKAQTRSLGPKALYQLEEAERKAAARRSAAERVADGLISGEGGARELVQMATRRKTGQGILVDYIDARRARALPEAIKLARPSEEGCRRLRKLFADTLDARIVLLACLPPDNRAEAFVGLLTPASVSRLQSASLELVFGAEWRSRLAELALTGKSAASGG
jgi:transcriptional regulator with XRE-family HTH domain